MEQLKEEQILKVDERKVVKSGDKILFTLYQEQEYTEEARQNIIKDMEEKLKQSKEWVSNIEKIKVENVTRLVDMLEKNKLKMMKDIEFLEQGLDTWKNPKEK